MISLFLEPTRLQDEPGDLADLKKKQQTCRLLI